MTANAVLAMGSQGNFLSIIQIFFRYGLMVAKITSPFLTIFFAREEASFASTTVFSLFKVCDVLFTEPTSI